MKYQFSIEDFQRFVGACLLEELGVEGPHSIEMSMYKNVESGEIIAVEIELTPSRIQRPRAATTDN